MVLAVTRRATPFRLGHVPALDGIRGIAIVLVVVYHLGQLLWPDAEAWLMPGGFVGVDLFFALSGFLITCLLLGELERRGRIRLRSFLWRRVLRLTPALAAVLAVLLIGCFPGWIPHVPLVQAKRSVWALLYMQTWNPKDHFPHPELAQTWSLAVEMHFYLLWSVAVAVIAAVFASRRTRPLMVAFAVAAVTIVGITRAMRSLDGQFPLELFSNTPNRIDGPFVGCLGGIAYASGRLDSLTRRWGAALAGAGLVGIAVFAAVGDPFSDWFYRGGFTLVAVVGTLAVVGAAQLGGEGRLAQGLEWPPLRGLGRVSYSLFLWHMPVFVVLQREAPHWPIPLRALVALAITATLTAASYHWVEKPVLRARRTARTDHDRAVEAPPEPAADIGPGPGLLPSPSPAPAPAEL